MKSTHKFGIYELIYQCLVVLKAFRAVFKLGALTIEKEGLIPGFCDHFIHVETQMRFDVLRPSTRTGIP